MNKSRPKKNQASPPHAFSSALWIWPESHNWDLHNSYAVFRRTFELHDIPAKAQLFITADQSYQLYVNGEYVCRGPARGFQSHWPYDEVDVREQLRKGRNVIAVRAHNPGFGNFQYLNHGYAGLLVAAKWGKFRLVSDKTWKCRRQTGIKRDTVPTSLQLFCQEHIDLRVEDPSWLLPDFDDTDWNSEIATAVWDAMPWSGLEARGIPQLEEMAVSPPCCIGVASGRCAKDFALTRDIARLRHSEGLVHEPCELGAGEIVVKPTGRGQFRSYLLDFGRTVVGSVGFEVLGARGGEILDTLHVETVDGRTPEYMPDRHSRMAFGHRMICREGTQTHTFYHAFGFRYMVLTVRDSTPALRVTPHMRSMLYPLVQNGGFRSSEATLNHIWEACVWTQRVCSLDAYVDTPWREQAQWWGDARVQAKNTFFLSGDTRLFRRGIAQIGAQTTPDGLTYGHSPTIAHSCILPDFTLIWLITLWDYFWQTGSLEPFIEQEQKILRALRYFQTITDPKTGLIGYDKRFWLFLDWSGLFKEGYPTVYSLWLLIALEKLASLFDCSGRQGESRELMARAGRLRKSLSLLIRKDGLLWDGFTFGGKIVKSTSIHAQTLAVLAGFHPEHNAIRVEKCLLPLIRGTSEPGPAPSSYWITHVFEVLAASGYGADVVDFIQRKWMPMAQHGTTWENFAPCHGDESFSHAWSAHPLYHLMEIIGGIRQGAVGWKKIIYQPHFLGSNAEVSVPTPLGIIYSSWRREGRSIQVSLALPKGISAELRLPGIAPKIGRGHLSWKLAA